MPKQSGYRSTDDNLHAKEFRGLDPDMGPAEEPSIDEDDERMPELPLGAGERLTWWPALCALYVPPAPRQPR
jgi:hypothetical protein